MFFVSRWCTCSHQLRLHRSPPYTCTHPPTPPPPLLCDYSTQDAPRRSPLSRSPLRQSASLTRRTSWFGPGFFFFPAFLTLSLCVCALLLLPGVNLRRREKKTYPSLSSVRGPLPICLHFPPRRHHWLPRRASQLASFPSPS